MSGRCQEKIGKKSRHDKVLRLTCSDMANCERTASVHLISREAAGRGRHMSFMRRPGTEGFVRTIGEPSKALQAGPVGAEKPIADTTGFAEAGFRAVQSIGPENFHQSTDIFVSPLQGEGL